MNRLKFHVIILAALVAVLWVESPVRAAEVKGATVTVYNTGQALVKEARSVTLPRGLASVVIKNVPRTLDPTSVRVSAHGMRVLDLQYSYVPITTSNLLDRYVGKELTVILPDPGDADARILRKATLLSNAEQPIFMVGNEVYMGRAEAVLFPELPKDLQSEPTLTLTSDSSSDGKREVLLSYLMGGLTWRADYALTVDREGKSAALEAWATITNTSGRAFSSMSLKLVAGEVQRAGYGRNLVVAAAKSMELMADAAPPAPEAEEFAQYHVYSIPRLVSLAASGMRQLSLFSASAISVEQTMVSRFNAGPNRHSGEIKQAVDVSIRFKNMEQNGLGRAMPAGLVRIFMPTSDGSQLLAGESGINHTPNGGEIKLGLGRSFDVKVERTQTGYRKVGKNSYEVSWKIVVTNGKSTPQKLRLIDSIPGEWEVVKADFEYAKVDSGSIEFNLGDVAPTVGGQPVVITYTAQISY